MLKPSSSLLLLVLPASLAIRAFAQVAPAAEGRSAIIPLAQPAGTSRADGLRAEMVAVIENLARTVRELGKPETNVDAFLPRLQACVAAIEETAAMLQGGARVVAEAEAAVHLESARMAIERTRLSPPARASLDEAIQLRKQASIQLKAAHEGLVDAMTPFLGIVDQVQNAATVAEIEAANAGFLTVRNQLPSAEDVRKLRAAFDAMTRVLRDSAPLLSEPIRTSEAGPR